MHPGASAPRPDGYKGKFGGSGHGHGGSPGARSGQKRFGRGQRGLVGGVAYYPGCNPATDTGIDIPVLLLAGDKDDWTSADRCRRMVAALARPSLVDAVYYPDAYHSFDAKAPDRTVAGAGKQHHLSFAPDAAPDAEARTKAFLAKVLR